jgi:hypothetical protein
MQEVDRGFFLPIFAACITGKQITVLNAKGLVIKPLSPAPAAAASSTQQQQQLQLPSSFSGAHMEVGEQVLAAGLPLNPGASLSLPVAVTVGKPPGDAFDAVMLQVGECAASTSATSCFIACLCNFCHLDAVMLQVVNT